MIPDSGSFMVRGRSRHSGEGAWQNFPGLLKECLTEYAILTPIGL